MNIISTNIHQVFLVQTTPFTDTRGSFYRAFCTQELDLILGKRQICQINVSRTETVGTVRGLHFQYPPHAEMKLVRCIRGCVWDVAVDLRKESPTFLQWYGVELSAGNTQMLMIPEGVAHGFQVLAPSSELLYLHTAFYKPDFEGGLRYNDPTIQISWPLPITEVSKRDHSHPLLTEDFQGLTL